MQAHQVKEAEMPTPVLVGTFLLASPFLIIHALYRALFNEEALREVFGLFVTFLLFSGLTIMWFILIILPIALFIGIGASLIWVTVHFGVIPKLPM